MAPYKRKTERALRFTDQLMRDIKRRLENNESKRSIAKSLGIHEATLRKRLKQDTIPTSLGRYCRVFNDQMEQLLVEHITHLDSIFFGISLKNLRSLAYKYAKENNIVHPFNNQKEMAGEDWAKAFCQRHKLSLRQPEKTSVARSIGFNRVQVGRFFDNLKTMYEKYNFDASNIYNMDETSVLTVPNKVAKVLTKQGKKSVGKVVSGERGQLITAVCCFSAAGVYVPPALIFPRKREKQELINGAPPGSKLMVSDSGFINTELFIQWLHHFQKFVKSSPEEPVLLILDNHSSHISLAIVEFCRSRGIHVLSLPPHCSHKIQPLDVGFFGPLKTAYSQEADSWMITNPGRCITQYQVAELFGAAYGRVAAVKKANNAFRATGIYPFNPFIFDDEDFAPANVTDLAANATINENNTATGVTLDLNVERTFLPTSETDSQVVEDVDIEIENDVLEALALNRTNTDAPRVLAALPVPQHNTPDRQLPSPRNPEHNETEDENEPIPIPTTPVKEAQTQDVEVLLQRQKIPLRLSSPVSKSKMNNEENKIVTPQQLYPIPKKKKACEQTRKRATKRSELLTSTPFKKGLEERQNSKPIPVRRLSSDDSRKLKRNLNSTEIGTDKAGPSGIKPKSNGNKTSKKKEPGTCPGCLEEYQDPPEDFDLIQCSGCNKWWHEVCTSFVTGKFICDLCV